jgi:hypothetical protein
MRVAAIISVTLSAIPCSGGHAQQGCVPIHFAPGTSSATVKGMASNEGPSACYTLTTHAGQTAMLTIAKTSRNDDIAFTIPDVTDNQDNYTFKTDAKTYMINVYLTFRAVTPRPFTMRVSVK